MKKNDENEIKYTWIALWIGNIILLFGLFGTFNKLLFIGGLSFSLLMVFRLFYLNNIKRGSKKAKIIYYLFVIYFCSSTFYIVSTNEFTKFW